MNPSARPVVVVVGGGIAGLAAAFDAAMWCFGIATTSIAVTALQGHSLGEKVMVVGAVTAANVAGSFAGVKIGKRFITEDGDSSK